MADRSCLVIILAAGEGTRMKSALPKVLHQVGGRAMVGHVLDLASAIGAGRRAVVIGPNADAVRKVVTAADAGAKVYEQTERLGTAHAVLAAAAAFAEPVDDVLILYGDTPLVTVETLQQVRAALADGADVAVLGFDADDPTGYGRLVETDGRLVAIREHRDASEAERQIRFCNSGVMGFAGARIAGLLAGIGNANAKGEYYLTDAVEIANAAGGRVVALKGDEAEFLGVNNRVELARAESIFQERRRIAAMTAGATLIAPETVFFAFDTKIGQDVLIEPNVVMGPGVVIEDGATVHAFSHLEGCRIGPRATVGPYARLRPGADLGEKAKVGNFVEIKKATVAEGAKVNHLTYIGDASIGAEANIGAGTITCNYDGFGKFRTEIGAGAFIGSNSALVAPVRIGNGAFVGSGSVVTTDVPDDALAVARGRQLVREGWAAAFRKRRKAEKEAAAKPK
ncbi:MAG: bifunctional UDP-N-acetylglucosamine diphosphorylase/glucosamine-1-phosphate N-acetyltransferase GlmU [Hyphomicrobiales bacterium]